MVNEESKIAEELEKLIREENPEALKKLKNSKHSAEILKEFNGGQRGVEIGISEIVHAVILIAHFGVAAKLEWEARKIEKLLEKSGIEIEKAKGIRERIVEFAKKI